MSLTPVYDTIEQGGIPLPYVELVFLCITSLDDEWAPGFTSGVIIGDEITVTTDAAGEFSVDLVPNSEIDPDNSVWRCVIKWPRAQAYTPLWLDVPVAEEEDDEPVPVRLRDILTTEPTDLPSPLRWGNLADVRSFVSTAPRDNALPFFDPEFDEWNQSQRWAIFDDSVEPYLEANTGGDGNDKVARWALVEDGVWTARDRLNALGRIQAAEPVVGDDVATSSYATALVSTEAAARAAADNLRLLLAGGTMSGNIAMGTNKITGLGDATTGTDALNRQTGDGRYDTLGAAAAAVTAHLAAVDPHGDRAYTDAQIAAMITTAFDYKASCRVATTANIVLSGTQVIDGIAVVVPNRILVKNQTTASENGIYTVSAGAWSRATDANADAEVTSGMAVAIEEGATHAGRVFMLTTANPVTLGVTNLTFSRVDAGDLAAANNLSDLNNAGTARTNLGLLGMATQDPAAVAITGGTITGITDLAIGDGGTGASTAANARSNLGLSSMATQNSANVAITGGTISGLTTLGASAAAITGGSITGTTFDIVGINTQSGATYTVATSDSSKLIKLTNAVSGVVTIDTNANVPMNTGAVVYFQAGGAGTYQVVGAGGVTVDATPGSYLRTQNSPAAAIKTATNTWLLVGDLSS